MGRSCEQCLKAFAGGDKIVEVNEGGVLGEVHAACEKEWQAEQRAANMERAPGCDACGKKIYPVSDGITFRPPGGDLGTIHAKCKDAWAAKHAPKCAHCDKPVTMAAVTLQWAKTPNTSGETYTVHEGCAPVFEEELKKKHKKAVAPPEEAPKTITLEPTAKRFRGEVCAHCNKKNMHDEMQVWTGPLGKLNVHTRCLPLLQKKTRNTDPGVGTKGTSRCDLCLKRFGVNEIPVMAKREGGTTMVEMHKACHERHERRRSSPEVSA